MEVKKTNGSFEEFSQDKIKCGICEAFFSIGEECQEPVLNGIIANLHVYDGITTSEVRRQVEEALMSINKKVARAYMSKYDDDKDIKKKNDFISDYIAASNAATGSKFDANANVSNKNVVTMGQELYKENNIKENRFILHNKIKKRYSKKLADQYLQDLDSHVLYKHDETGVPGMPYCVAISMYPFLEDGLRKLGGPSGPPTDTKSFCGEFINLVYSISSQFMGACLHKSQKLIFEENGTVKAVSVGDFINNKFTEETPAVFENFEGQWEAIKANGLKVNEDGRLVDVKKLYRRKYSDKIFEIKTRDGHCALVSKDHKFKVLYKNRTIEVKAEDLQLHDTVFVNKDNSYLLNKNSQDYKNGWTCGVVSGDESLTWAEWIRDQFTQYTKELWYINTDKSSVTPIPEFDKEFCDNAYSYIIRSKDIRKHIEDISKYSLDYLCGFLDGLCCTDGSYSQSEGITICLPYRAVIENIVDIVNLMGYEKPTIKTIAPKGDSTEKYSVCLPTILLKYLNHTLKANEISYYDSTANNYGDATPLTDVVFEINSFDNDDNYVYEIETASHWYNCGGFITHNCATPEYLMYLNYFLEKDYGLNYHNRVDDVVENTTKQRTLGKVIDNYFQQVVHSMNMPAGNRG